MMREPGLSLVEKRVLVLGLGDTGVSVARWVEREGGRVRAADTRAAPPGMARFAGELHTGAFTSGLLAGVDLVCISPGLSLAQPLVREARDKGIPVVGDIELFAWKNRSPVLAITGTNGKTTVTALTGHLLRAAGVDCEVAGNIAPPVLDAALRRATPPAAWASSSPAISSKPPSRCGLRPPPCSTSAKIISTATRASRNTARRRRASSSAPRCRY